MRGSWRRWLAAVTAAMVMTAAVPTAVYAVSEGEVIEEEVTEEEVTEEEIIEEEEPEEGPEEEPEEAEAEEEDIADPEETGTEEDDTADPEDELTEVPEEEGTEEEPDEETGIAVMSLGTEEEETPEGEEDGVAAADNETSYAATVTTSDGTTTSYTSLSSAISAITADNATVTLLSDTTVSGSLTIQYDITLDLGGYTLAIEYDSSVSTSYYFYVNGTNGYTGDLTVKNGTITDKRSYNNSTHSKQTFYVIGSAALTLEDVTVQAYRPNSYYGYNYLIYEIASGNSFPSVTLKGETVIKDLVNTTTNTYGCIGVTVIGGYTASNVTGISFDTDETTSLVIESGVTISTYCNAIAGNGSTTASTHGTTIKIDGATIDSGNYAAIFHPQYGEITITNSTISGTDGIEVRAGVVEIEDSNITATETSLWLVPNNNGTSTDGVGVAISQHTTDFDISVTLKECTVTGAAAVYEEDLINESSSNISLHIEGGTYTSTGSTTYRYSSSYSLTTSTEAIPAVYSENCTGFICHGTFISNAEEDLDSNYVTTSPCSGGTPVMITSDGKTYVHSLEEIQAVEATCTEDGNIAYYKCTYATCDAIFTAETETGEDEDGNEITETTYTQVNESDVTIEATGHDWGDPEWTWTQTDSGYSVSAAFVCGNESSHVYTETAEVTVSSDEDGNTVYTATVSGPDNAGYTDTLVTAAEDEDTDDGGAGEEDNSDDGGVEGEDEDGEGDEDNEDDVTNKEDNEDDVTDGEDDENDGNGVTDDEDVYALVIVYDGNEGTRSGEESYEVGYYIGDVVYIPECEFVLEGYTFVCWNTAADGSGVTYVPYESDAVASAADLLGSLLASLSLTVQAAETSGISYFTVTQEHYGTTFTLYAQWEADAADEDSTDTTDEDSTGTTDKDDSAGETEEKDSTEGTEESEDEDDTDDSSDSDESSSAGSSASTTDSSSSSGTSSSDSSSSAAEQDEDEGDVLGDARGDGEETAADEAEGGVEDTDVFGDSRDTQTVAATGDDSNLAMWLLLLAAAGAGLAAAVRTGRRRA